MGGQIIILWLLIGAAWIAYGSQVGR